MTKPDTPLPQARGSDFFRTLKTVAWSFVGIRKKSEFEQDLAKVNPLHVVAVAFFGVAMLVAGLILVVQWVVAK